MSSSETVLAPSRFTLDGSPELEASLGAICDEVLEAVKRVISARRLEGLVLGGGYGRGEGGVLKTEAGERPYNDLEFYVFLRGNRILNERRYRAALESAAEALSGPAGVHVEFKLDSLGRLRGSPISMFTYDLVSAHRILDGRAGIFAGCEHHLAASRVPLAEATRLLFNRCTGLLLAREMLRAPRSEPGARDFIKRNIAKARLALGDALLTAVGAYHWSCLERDRRLGEMQPDTLRPGGPDAEALEQIKAYHRAGVAFKLHPEPAAESFDELEAQHREVSRLARQTWLWVETVRLSRVFKTPSDYAFADINKCSENPGWRNLLLNLNTFGWRSVFDKRCWRYPRERLLNSLPLLLWEEEQTRVCRHLQAELDTSGGEWPQLLAAYKRIWPRYN